MTSISAAAGIATGILVLIGWSLDIGALKSAITGYAPMKPLTAVCFVLTGLSLCLCAAAREVAVPPSWRRSGGRIAALAVLVSGLLTLIEYLFGLDAGIDLALFPRAVAAETHHYPGRISEISAFNFIALSGAVLLLDRKFRVRCQPAEILALMALFGGTMPFFGYLYGAHEFYRSFAQVSIALHTSVLFILLSLGLLFARRRSGLMSVIFSPHAGGWMARRFLPIAIVLSMVAAWLGLEGQRAGRYTAEIGVALFLTATIVITSSLVLLIAAKLNRADAERDAVEDALQLSEQRFRLLVDGVRDYAIFMLDPEGRVITWNSGAERLKGYSAEEVLGSSVARFFPPEAAAAGTPQAQLRCALEQERCESEGWRLRKDGSRFWANVVTSTVRDDSGTLVGFAKVTRDLTERRRAEESLRQANENLERKVLERTLELQAAKEQAEAADRLKTQFLSAMSHELRTPLNAIIGFSGMLLMGFPGPVNAEQRRQLEAITTSAKHQLSLVDDLLDIGRIETGKLELKIESVDCRSLVEDVATMLRTLAHGKKLGLSVDACSGDFTLPTDRRALKQILINLANNAVKFTESGGVRISLRRLSGRTAISVADTGPGIKQEDQAKLFNSFTRLGNGDTRPREGTGLGLYLSRKLADLLGAQIIVESEYGKGSTFTLALPDSRMSA